MRENNDEEIIPVFTDIKCRTTCMGSTPKGKWFGKPEKMAYIEA